MAKFNPTAVAKFICSQHYTMFEYEVRGLVAREFGCTTTTAGKWVSRLLDQGMIKRSGKCAIMMSK